MGKKRKKNSLPRHPLSHWSDHCDAKKSVEKKAIAVRNSELVKEGKPTKTVEEWADSELSKVSHIFTEGSTITDPYITVMDELGNTWIGGIDSSSSIISSSWDSSSGTVITTRMPDFSLEPDPPMYVEEEELKQIEKKENNEKKTITMKRMNEILEKVYTTPSLRKSIVPLFIGNPGLGKTVIIQEFAREKKATLVELITSQMSPFEISGIAMPDKEIKKMVYYNFDKLENLKDGDILFFDELLNGNPVVLNACLTILEQRKFISGKDLPDIMIIAAANPQGMSPLTPQIKERFIWYTVGFDKKMWIDYMVKKFQITKNIGNKLAGLIKSEEFLSNNFNTPRSIDKAVNMLIYDVPTPYTETIRPIIEELIANPFEEVVHLPNSKELAPAEMISWLDLIKLKYN